MPRSPNSTAQRFLDWLYEWSFIVAFPGLGFALVLGGWWWLTPVPYGVMLIRELRQHWEDAPVLCPKRFPERQVSRHPLPLP